ncbi:hypothetical protein BAE44_0001746 [Dichanthelium oligosanthes]|uniref:Uncharacterized protein n=1 Tax=Dichanthelium oligosanthes TaxID=888268 RepID=A0A1E5WIL1_9POAL|nr:hypothetical protein BAE44_0001746 [Dichanthelium oligosanthes]
MARVTAPSRRPPSAVAAVAASSPPAAAAPARVPQRRTRLAAFAARGALSHLKGGPYDAHLAAPAPAPPWRQAPVPYACSPTTHPGSFRCALHRGAQAPAFPASALLVSSRLSAPQCVSMANPLVRIVAMEGGDQIRRALASLVYPPPASQHQ